MKIKRTKAWRGVLATSITTAGTLAAAINLRTNHSGKTGVLVTISGLLGDAATSPAEGSLTLILNGASAGNSGNISLPRATVNYPAFRQRLFLPGEIEGPCVWDINLTRHLGTSVQLLGTDLSPLTPATISVIEVSI